VGRTICYQRSEVNIDIFIPFYNINLLIVFHTVLQDSESVGQEEDSEGVRQEEEGVGQEDEEGAGERGKRTRTRMVCGRSSTRTWRVQVRSTTTA
jgi:hypothetical protein